MTIDYTPHIYYHDYTGTWHMYMELFIVIYIEVSYIHMHGYFIYKNIHISIGMSNCEILKVELMILEYTICTMIIQYVPRLQQPLQSLHIVNIQHKQMVYCE